MSEITRRSYISAIKDIDDFPEKNKISTSGLYRIDDYTVIKNIANKLLKNDSFIEYDTRQNNLFREAITKYAEFLCSINDVENEKHIFKKDELISILIERKIQYIDNRNKNGCLWIIGNKELLPFVWEFKDKGIHFTFCESGGKATNGESAWWTRDYLELNDKNNNDLSKYEKILFEFFPKGFRINSGLDMKRFRRFWRDKSNSDIVIDDDSIRSNIKEIGISYQDFVYLPKAMIDENAHQKLLDFIEKIFNEGKNAIYYESLFKEMSNVLQGQKIYNPEMLKVYLSYALGKKYYLDKDYIAVEKDISINPYEEVKLCLKTQGIPIQLENLVSMLGHIPENKIMSAIRSNKEFICNRPKEYFHVDIIDLSGNELELISRLIKQSIIEKGFIIDSELIDNINIKYPAIIERYSMLSTIGLRDTIAYKLNEEFSFTGKIISEPDKSVSMYNVFANFCKSRGYFKLEDLNSLKRDLDTTIYFEAVYGNALRISESDFVPIKLAQFDIERTDKAIDRFFIGEYISLSEIRQFGSFPEAGFPWNNFLLGHYVSSFSMSYKLLHNGFSASVCVGGIVKKESKIDKFDDLLVDVLASSNINLTIDEAIEYLYDSGFIGRRRIGNIDQIIINANALRTQKGKQT